MTTISRGFKNTVEFDSVIPTIIVDSILVF